MFSQILVEIIWRRPWETKPCCFLSFLFSGRRSDPTGEGRRDEKLGKEEMTRKNQNQKVVEDQIETQGPDAASTDLTMEQMLMLMMQKQLSY